MTRPGVQPQAPFLDQLSPASASSPWYCAAAHGDSSDVERTQNSQDFDLLAAESTPLHVNHGPSVLFTSPIKRLDKLHLDSKSSLPSAHRQVLEPRVDSDSDLSHCGNLTIVEEDSDSDNEASRSLEKRSDSDESSRLQDQLPDSDSSHSETSAHISADPPKFMRKRKHTESPAPMEITPAHSNHTIPHGSDMSGIIGNDTAESILKVSFSASDSTPCPSQPRKRLKFKIQDDTPSQPRTRLNLDCSKKLSASSLPLLSKLNNAQDSKDSDTSSADSLRLSHTKNNPNSTPISQLTPANSRPNSPALESDDEINGYRFVKPNFKYQTPQGRSTSAFPRNGLLSAYHSQNFAGVANYEIVGDFPASAAGLMDEDGVHIGDKRINDPYMGPAEKESDSVLLDEYLRSDKLPLLAHFKLELTHSEMSHLISDGKSVSAFYRAILPHASQETMRGFLKKERLRWHPDKWSAKLDGSPFNQAVIGSLAQVLNALAEQT